MELATQILVIIVSVFLTVFLIISITVLILVIKLIKELKRVAAKAEKLADNAAHVGEFFKDVSGPLAIIKLIRNIIKTVQKS